MASNSQLHASSENFNTQLELFYKQNKIDLRTNPRIGRTRINLYNLYSHVIELGGSSKVDTENQWTSLIPHFNGVAADELRNVYKEYLEAYEQVTFWGKQYVVSNKRKSGNESPDPTKKLKRESTFKASAPQKPAPLFEDTEYTDGGYSNRILLALESQLPNEVDWALKKLLRITFTSDRFQFSVIPGLLDLLIEMMNDYIDKEMKHIKKVSAQSNGLAHEASPLSLASEEIFHAYQSREERERVFLISAILWNSSFAVDNIRIFVCFPPLKELIVKALSLPSSSSYLEIKLSLLDVMDNIAFCFKLTPKDDPLIPVLNKLVFDNDRGLILGAIRTLVRLAIIESNDQALKSTLDPKIVPRMYQLLLLPDEEIVASVLDYFYQYSLLSTAISTQFAELAPSNPVKIFMKFLGYKIPSNVAFMPPKIVFQTSKRSEAGKEKDGLTKDQQTKIAALVKDANLLKQLLFETFTVMSNGTELKLEKMEEPGRFGAWMVKTLEDDPSSTPNLEQLYENYKASCKEGPYIGITDFLKLMMLRFGSVPVLPGASPTNIIIPGCRIKSSPSTTESKPGTEDGTSDMQNVQSESSSLSSVKTEPAQAPPSSSSTSTTSAKDVKPSSPSRKPSSAVITPQFQYLYPNQLTSSHIREELSQDPSGIALTAALVLRNFSRNPWMKEHFWGCMEDLVVAAAKYPRLSRYLGTVVSEVK